MFVQCTFMTCKGICREAVTLSRMVPALVMGEFWGNNKKWFAMKAVEQGKEMTIEGNGKFATEDNFLLEFIAILIACKERK